MLVTVDTLRADHLGCYGYFRPTSPEIDRLASESLVFDNVVTPMPTTLPAHTSLMTSMLPVSHGVDRNTVRFEPAPGRRTLAEKLRERGYRTKAVASAYPLFRDSGIAVGFDEFSEPGSAPTEPGELRLAEDGTTIHSARAAVATRTTSRWLESTGRSGPFFLWIHYWDPHSPYAAPSPFDKEFRTSRQLEDFLEARGVSQPTKERKRPDVAAREPGSFDPISPAEANNSYDGEVRYVDQQIGLLLAKLRDLGLYDDAAIVLTGDHGEGLYQHNWLGHGRLNNEQLFVPLIIKPPRPLGRAPGRSARPGSLIDVVPTLYDLMGLEPSVEELRQFQGRSLVAAPPNEPSAVVQKTPAHRGPRALLTSKWKLFAYDNAPPRLFDLEADPFELRDVADLEPDETRRLTRQLETLLDVARLPQADSRTEEALEELRALGYVN